MVTLFNFQRYCLVIILCLFFGAPAGARTLAWGVEAAVSPLAAELVQTIGTWRTDRGADRLRVAIWPTRKQSETPVPLATARTFDEALLSALTSIRPKWLTIIGRRELASVIEDLQERTGNFAEALKFVAENSAVDILLIPMVRIEAGITTLSYKAVSAVEPTVGEIVAKTMAHKIAQRSTTSELTIDQAVAQAVEKFGDRANDLKVLYLGPIFYKSTPLQTEFSRNIRDRMGEGLTDRFAGMLTGREVILHDREPKKNSPKIDGNYVLGGTYWDFSGIIDLRLNLRRWPTGQTVSWSGRVRPPSSSEILPPGNFPSVLFDNDGLGPIGFSLSSERGDNPVYKFGDKMVLLLETEQDAWVYCFYRQANREWFRLFPNSFYPDPLIARNRRHRIPDDNYTFDFVVKGPIGTELLKCFAANEDVTRKLPEWLRKDAFEPLRPGLDHRLTTIFQNLRGVSLSEASLVVTIEE
jgi:hypothetical protein